MFRCVSPDGSSHRFAGTLPRLIAEGEVCQYCDNEVHRHQGPLLTRDYEFHLRLAAKALLDVGNGMTYTEAAARARATAGRGAYGGVEPNGALVAEWIDVLAPLLVQAHAETRWPETVMVDSTNFIISNTWMGTSKQAFAIVAVYGYPQRSTHGRLLDLYATHEHLAENYGEAFAYFEELGNQRAGVTGVWTPPTMLLTDGERALLHGMTSFWNAGIGPGFGTGTAPYAKRCEWHLRKNAKRALKQAGITSVDDPIQPVLDAAFQSLAGWDAFCLAAKEFPQINRYVQRNDAQVRDQVTRREALPQHHSSAALETVLERVRQQVERRAFAFRNQRRTNLLLGLMRNHELRVDDLDHYTELLREAARAAGGRIQYQRRGYCAGRAFDLRP